MSCKLSLEKSQIMTNELFLKYPKLTGVIMWECVCEGDFYELVKGNLSNWQLYWLIHSKGVHLVLID